MHTNGNGYACGNAKFRLVMLMGSALIANCIEHSSGYLRIREYFPLFLCHKCEYSVKLLMHCLHLKEKQQIPYN